MVDKASKDTTCSLKVCKNGGVIDQQTQRHIEVKTFDTETLTSSFIISWTRKFDAKFHTNCWTEVVKAARCRNLKRSPFPRMNDIEKKMVKEAVKTAETFDSFEEIKTKAKSVAEVMTSSRYCVVFTGAGISTSAGIGDYRGKDGKWTNEDRCQNKHEEPPAKQLKTNDSESEEDEDVDYEKLMPTYTHEAIHKLIDLQLVKFVISQNCDGLHVLSGVKGEHLSELHGNVFIEQCEKCGRKYERPHYVMDDAASQYFEEISDHGQTTLAKPKHALQCPKCHLTHRTGRKCETKGCNGFLQDTIINFRDDLGEENLENAMKHARKSDLILCLGSSLTVTPANEILEMTKQPQRLVICNRQATHLDYLCDALGKDGEALGCRVWGDCDLLMAEVMKGVMSLDDLNVWEQERNVRLNNYAKYRKR